MKLNSKQFIMRIMGSDRIHIPLELKVKYELNENTYVMLEDNGNGFTVTPTDIIKRVNKNGSM